MRGLPSAREGCHLVARITRTLRVVGATVAFLAGGVSSLEAQRSGALRRETYEDAAPLSIALIDVPLVQALETLSQQARLNLVWQQATLGSRATTRVTCRHERSTAEVVLACITKAAGLDYVRLSSGTYVVITAAEQAPSYATIGGQIIDAASGSPLPQARVQLAELAQTVVATDDGGFSFPKVLPGRYELVVRAVGYRPYREQLVLPAGVSRPLRLSLTRTEVSSRPIIVNGTPAGAMSATLGGTTLGDSLALRTLQGPSVFLPGTASPLGTSRRDGIGDLHLQGGDVGEHPWRLDGIPLYDVTTLSGLLGVVSPLAIDQLTVRRSGFRARDGSFATGVIDLRHDLGDATDGSRTQLQMDPIAAAAKVRTPLAIGSANGVAVVTARTGVWQWAAPAALTRAMRHWSTPDPVLLTRLSGLANQPGMAGLDGAQFATSLGDERVKLNDVHLATRLQRGLAHTVESSVFASEQGISYDGSTSDSDGHRLSTRDSYDWRTLGAQLTHQWFLGTRVRQRVQVRGSHHALSHAGSMSMNGALLTPSGAGERNAITEFAASGEWRIGSGGTTELLLGADLAHTRAELDLGNRVLRPMAFRTAVTRGSLLADVTQALGAQRFLDAGVRVTQLQNGETFAEPRVAIRGERALTSGALTWRVAAGGYHQFVNQFDVASTMPVAFVPSVRFWLPADGRSPVAQSWHTSSEVAWSFARGWEVRGEVYGRWHPSLPMFDYGALFDSAGTQPLTDAAAFIARSRGRAFGGGVRVIRDARFRGQAIRSELGYDGGQSVRRFPSRFDAQLQPTPWTEPHRALWAVEWQPTSAILLATRLRGVWGRPWALRQAYYDLFGAAPMSSGLPISMPGRMTRPGVIDADMGATYARQLYGRRVELGVSVLNAIDRRNVLDYALRRDAGGGYQMVPRFMPQRQTALTLRVGG